MANSNEVKVVISDTHTSRATHARKAEFFKDENAQVKSIPKELLERHERAFDEWVAVQRELRKYLE